jgi:hypothetical protein
VEELADGPPGQVEVGFDSDGKKISCHYYARSAGLYILLGSHMEPYVQSKLRIDVRVDSV